MTSTDSFLHRHRRSLRGSGSWMFLLLRLGDAVFDPVIGLLSDRTQTPLGQIPSLDSVDAIPFGLIFWLVYVTPNAGPSGKPHLRLHHLHPGDDDVLRQQHAVFRPHGCDDARRQRAEQHRQLPICWGF